MKPPVIVVLFSLLLAALACNLPGSIPSGENSGATLTSVAQTVIAQFATATTPPGMNIPTLQPGSTTAPLIPTAPPATDLPIPTLQPSATFTSSPIPSPTNTVVPCNRAQFLSDISIPDGTQILINQGFTKTWRLKNTGSCNWTSSYQLFFDHGNQMNGPGNQQLTLVVIAPGQTIDISVDLTAPAAAGNYKGYWKIRDQNGVDFGVSTGPFFVEINAVTPTPTSTPTPILPAPVGAIVAPLVTGESGSVRANGVTASVTNLGDIEANIAQQAFLSFDISAIPAGSTILQVKINFSNFDTLGNPFSLGCIRMYPQNYGAIDASDFTDVAPLGAVARWCSQVELSNTSVAPDILTTLQSAVGNNRARFRVQFNEVATNSDGVADMVRLGNNLQLIISFTH